eukprot:2872711-Rhodomonas_salina.1
MPQFQNIIDPDLYVTDSTTLASVWIPTDFEVVEQTRPDIISTLVIKKAYENATGTSPTRSPTRSLCSVRL